LTQDKDNDLSEISSQLTQLGYSVQLDDEIIGFSSTTHTTPLTARKKDKILLFGVSEKGDTDELIQLLGEKMDIENSTAVFLDRYGNKELLSLAQVYNITVIDLTKPDWKNKLQQVLNKNEPKNRNELVEQ